MKIQILPPHNVAYWIISWTETSWTDLILFLYLRLSEINNRLICDSSSPRVCNFCDTREVQRLRKDKERMYSSWLLSLLVAAICACNCSGFISNRRIVSKNIIQGSTNLLETPTLLTEIVQVKVIVSGKNVQGPWYRTTVRHEVRDWSMYSQYSSYKVALLATEILMTKHAFDAIFLYE